MQLIYNDTDITRSVDVVKCIHRDVSGGRCDSLEIVLENAAAWYRWQPKKDDQIEVRKNGYSTGIMYLNAILPENGKYRILATSLPAGAQRKKYASYENTSLGDLISLCAAECGLDGAVYGVDSGILYPYLMRGKESAPAFLSRILRCEGAVLKTLNGKLTAIGIEYAQGLNPVQVIDVKSDQRGVRHQMRDDLRLATITIDTPYAHGTAADGGAVHGQHETYTYEYPAIDNAQAGRWARGLLLHNNRNAEEIIINADFNPRFTAMVRIDINGTHDMAGKWLIDEAEHDLFGSKSKVKLLRCVDTIW